MKNFVRVLSVISIFACLALVFTGSHGRARATDGARDDGRTYLIAGLDEAAENTDVICLCRLNFKTGAVSLIQLPRDTYCNFGVYPNKVNQLYMNKRRDGLDERASAEALSDFLSDSLGVDIDEYLLLNSRNVISFIDGIGGIYVSVDAPITLKNGDREILSLVAGENRLSGEDSYKLIRHRSGYDGGDLERLDVQKLFWRSLAKTVTDKVDGVTLICAFEHLLSEAVTSFTLSDALTLAPNAAVLKNGRLEAMTLSGAAVKDVNNGLWYYSLNKRGATDMLESIYADEHLIFDEGKIFLNSENSEFEKIYYK